MKESKLCTEIVNKLKHYDYFAYKIPDPSSDFQKTVKRPFDIFAYNLKIDSTLAIEVKVSTTKYLNIDRIAVHQYSSLKQFKHGYIIVYNAVTKMYSYIHVDNIIDSNAFKDIKGFDNLTAMLVSMLTPIMLNQGDYDG